MVSYKANRAWSDCFLPEIKRIVGPYLLVNSPNDIDCEQAADLIILRARDMMVACRVRRPGYAERYPRQFTVRSRLDNGCETELHKIVNGFGDWMFYGHAVSDGCIGICPWWIIDLDAFRAHLIRDGSRGRKTIQAQYNIPNGDGTCFSSFQIDSFKGNPPILVAENTVAVVKGTISDGKICTTGLPIGDVQAKLAWSGS